MEKLKVLDFDYGCGGFTKGLEDTKLFEVVYNGSINDKNRFCYNKIHDKKFDEKDIMPKDIDLAVFTPNLGHKLTNSKNFLTQDLNNFLALILLNDFDNLIFITLVEAIPLLQNSKKVLLTSDNFPTKDIISVKLLQQGYNLYNFVLDGAGYGLPQHKYYNIYWASKVTDKNIYIKEGYGFYKKKYRTPRNALKGITDDSNLTWHKPNYKKESYCRLIKCGSSAYKTDSIPVKKGYKRIDPDKISAPLLYDFYNTTSSSFSIHPFYDRPLTIREGARLFGLDDYFSWDFGLTNNEVGRMIYNSFPPFISILIGRKIVKLLK